MSDLLDCYVRVSRQELCPICDKPDWCLIARDGATVICRRIEQGSVTLTAAGWLHRLRDDGDWSPPPAPKPPKPTPPKLSLEHLKNVHQRYRQNAEAMLPELANRLGLHGDVLDRLEVGYCHYENFWAIPERDAKGNVIGLQRRYWDNTQRRLKGGKTGLTSGDFRKVSH